MNGFTDVHIIVQMFYSLIKSRQVHCALIISTTSCRTFVKRKAICEAVCMELGEVLHGLCDNLAGCVLFDNFTRICVKHRMPLHHRKLRFHSKEACAFVYIFFCCYSRLLFVKNCPKWALRNCRNWKNSWVLKFIMKQCLGQVTSRKQILKGRIRTGKNKVNYCSNCWMASVFM